MPNFFSVHLIGSGAIAARRPALPPKKKQKKLSDARNDQCGSIVEATFAGRLLGKEESLLLPTWYE